MSDEIKQAIGKATIIASIVMIFLISFILGFYFASRGFTIAAVVSFGTFVYLSLICAIYFFEIEK